MRVVLGVCRLCVGVLCVAGGVLGFFVAGAFGAVPEAPEVSVELPAHATGVVVRGVLSPGAVGEAGSYEFLFREGASCVGGGKAPEPAGLMQGLEHEEVSEALSGLKAGSEYTVCLRAENSEGATVGPGVSFTTAIAPELPETLVAEPVTAGTAVLRGVLNPKAAGDAGSFEFLYRMSGSECGEASVTGPVPAAGGEGEAVSLEVGGLQPATQYTACVLARNEAGEEALGAPVTFTTAAAAPVVESESVSGVSAGDATFEALVNAENQKTSVVFEYAVEEALLGTAGATTLSAGELAAGLGGQPVAVGAGGVLEAGRTYFYRAVAENQQSRKEGNPVDGVVQSFTTAIAPEAPETVQAQPVTAGTAVLRGVLNPNHEGNAGIYEIVFRRSGNECEGEGEAATPPEAMSGIQGQTVENEVTGLLPGTPYTFCVRVENAAGEKARGPPVTFTTLPAKPVLTGEAAENLTASSVDLTAGIDPEGATTKYHFEYDTREYLEGEPAHGTSLPEGSLPAGTTSVLVPQHVSGLSPDTTYYWRLMAGNTAGSSTGPDHTFIDETASGQLPDARQYELVTPALKNGALISGALGGGSAWPPRIAENGLDMIALSLQCLEGTKSCTGARLREGEAYEFTRTSQGWVTHPLAPPVPATGASTLWAADAGEHATLFSQPSPPEGQDDFYTTQANGAITHIGPLGQGEETYRDLLGIVATSGFTHVLYQGSQLWALDGIPENEASLYEYAGTGNAHPLSVGVTGGPGSTSLISGCGTLLGSGSLGGIGTKVFGSLSGDGQTAYFTAVCGPTASHELYERVDGELSDAHSVLVSTPTPSTCESPECQAAPHGSGIFAGASGDGSRVIFTSTQQLTDNASQGTGQAGTQCPHVECNLYESTCTAPCGMPPEAPAAKERRLIDLSEGAKATGGPRVQGVMAISPDGSHVYFVARGVLTEQENQQHQKAVDGANNLYLSIPGQTPRYITTLPPADEQEFKLEKAFEWTQGIGVANVTPEGRYLVFLSHGALTPDDTRPAAEGAPTPPAQVYRYDAETGMLVRISIGSHGFNDNGNAGTVDAGISLSNTGYALGVGSARADPTMSHNGEYVFFESPVALAPGALDDVQVSTSIQGVPEFAENVYEYHNGNVSLISDGKDTTANSGTPGIVSSVRLLGSDATGANVFFATNDQLTGQDTDTQRDYYDAHICSSTEPCPTPPPPPAPACQEGGCQNPAPTPPTTSPLNGSNTLQSLGNLPPTPPAPPTAHATILTHTSHGTTKFTIRIKLPLTGHITITSPNTHKTSRTLHPGTQTIQITLTTTAQHQLHHKHKLTIKLHTTYTPTNNTPTTTNTTITLTLTP